MKESVNDSSYMIDGNLDTLTYTFLQPNIHKPTESLFISITVLLKTIADVSRVDVYSVPKDKDSSMWGFMVRAEVGSSVRVCGKIKSDSQQVELYCPSTCRGDKIIFEKWFNDYESDGVSLSVAEIVVYGRTAKKTTRKLSPEVVTLVTIGVVMSAFFITVKLSSRCGKLLEGKTGDEDEEDPENTFQVDVTEIVEESTEVMNETIVGKESKQKQLRWSNYKQENRQDKQKL